MKEFRINAVHLLSALAIALAFWGCNTIRPTGTKGAGKYYEKFFIGADGNQYLVKSITFNSKNGETAEMDVTFRYKDEVKDSAMIKISFLSSGILRNADSLTLSNQSDSMTLRKPKFLFAEKTDGGYLHKYSGKASLTDVRKLFATNKWRITMHMADTVSIYIPPKKSRIKIRKLNNYVFGGM